MNKSAILLFSILLFSQLIFATGQRSELIIYNGDTLALYTEPLYQYLRIEKNANNFNGIYSTGCSTALWRGYQGLWKISSGRLILIDLYLCADKSQSIKKILFPDREGEIRADWFTGPLYIQHGKMLKYVHFGFESISEQETQFNVVEGVIESSIEYTNGVRQDDRGFPRDSEKVKQYIYQHLNWGLFPKLSNKVYLNARFDINEQGYITNIRLNGQADNTYHIELLRVLEEISPLQILYKRDIGYQESWGVPITFSKKMKKKYIH
jgi:hypothetical protein